jgi:hypothetical protein
MLRAGDIFAGPLGRRSGTGDKLLYLLLALTLFGVTRIALAQVCINLIILLWLGLLLTRRTRPYRQLPLMLPLIFLIFQGVVSAALSMDPLLSLRETLGLLNVLVLLLFYNISDGEEDVLPLIQVVVVMGGMVALVGLGQYFIDDVGGVAHRISGPMGHYMTYSGILMLVDVVIIALLASTT